MKKYDEILILSDLEGTLLDEESSQIDKEGFEKFLQELSKLEDKMHAKAGIHILSPIGVRRLENIILDFNDLIEGYNSKNGTSLKRIVAGCSPTSSLMDEDYESRYVVAINSKRQSGGKRFYTETVINYMKDRKIKAFPIYIGNGLNDIDAMIYVKNEKGIILAPKENLEERVKIMANYVGEGENIIGVTNALRQYMKELSLEER